MKINNTVRPLPRQFEIAGIRTVLVDPHNDVLPHWFSAYRDRPFVVVRADRHEDMLSNVKIPYDCVNLGPSSTIPDYLKTNTNIQNFTIPAFHHRIVCAAYMFGKGSGDVTYFGKVLRGGIADPQSTVVLHGVLNWAEGCGSRRVFDHTLTYAKAFKSLENSPFPLITDIDLDVIACRHDRDYAKQFGELSPAGIEQKITSRIDRLGSILINFPRPELITIARSQTPHAYTPPEHVDMIEEGVISMLGKCYR